MIRITTEHPQRRAEIPFHDHLIPVASTLFQKDPHLLQKNVFDRLHRYVVQIVGWGIYFSKASRWSVYMSPLPRKIKQRFFAISDYDPDRFYLFFCDDFFEAIHKDLQRRRIPGLTHKDPIRELWETLTDDQKESLRKNRHTRIDSFDRFRTKVLVDMRALTSHESEVRRIGLAFERQRDRTG